MFFQHDFELLIFLNKTKFIQSIYLKEKTMVSLLSEANDLGTGFCRISSEDSNTFVEIDKF